MTTIFDAASNPTPGNADRPTVRVPRSGRAKKNRRADILQTLAQLLEDPHCDRITTAQIAKKLDLSEAALYEGRHV